jgi:hypothetical protein
MFLNCSDFITEPDRDLVNALAGGDQQTRERVSHNVRRYPFAALGFHVFHERRAEIVAIQPFAVWHIRPQHERRAEPVGSKKTLEFESQWNRSLFAVLKIDGLGFAEIQPTRIEIEPKGSSFHDLLKTQTSVKSAEQNELELVVRRFGNESVAKIKRAEIFARAADCASESHVLGRIATCDPCDFDSPPEKRAHSHNVAQGGSVGGPFESFVVETLDLSRCNHGRRCVGWEAGSKKQQLVALGHRAGTRVFLLADFVSDKSIDFRVQRGAQFKGNVLAHRFSTTDGFCWVSGFKRNEVSFAVTLNCKPVNVSAGVDAAAKFSFLFGAHKNRLSHFDCHTFNKKIAFIALYSWVIRGNSDESPYLKELLRRWFRVRVPADPPSFFSSKLNFP